MFLVQRMQYLCGNKVHGYPKIIGHTITVTFPLSFVTYLDLCLKSRHSEVRLALGLDLSFESMTLDYKSVQNCLNVTFYF